MVVEGLYLNAGIDYTMVGEVDLKQTSASPTVPVTLESHNILEVNAGAKYAFNADLAVSLGYTMTQTDDYTVNVKHPTYGDIKVERKDISDYAVNVGVDYSF